MWNKPLGLRVILFIIIFFKLNKALYGLKQAPKAWCEKLSSFILENEFERGKVDTQLPKTMTQSYFSSNLC